MWQILEITANLSRRYSQVGNKFFLHALHHLAFTIGLTQVSTNLTDILLMIFLQLLAGTNHGNHIIQILLYAL